MKRTYKVIVATLLNTKAAASADGVVLFGAKWVFAAVMTFWGTRTAAVQLLFLLCVIDYLTGVASAIKLRRITSHKSYWGLMKKLAMFVMVMVGSLITKTLKVNFDLGEAIALGYVVNEVISITENCHKLGVPVPSVLMVTLLKVKDLVPGSESVRDYKRLHPTAKMSDVIEELEDDDFEGDGDGEAAIITKPKGDRK